MKNWRGSLLLFTLAGILALSGCKKKKSEQNTSGKAEAKTTQKQQALKITEKDLAKAKELFKSRCASCHGEDGKGDGTAAKGMNPKPRNFHDPKWQKSVTDEHIEKVIVYGGAAVGKSPAMIPNPDLGNPSNKKKLKALVQLIRQFGKQKDKK